MGSELIDLREDQPADPRYAACYASGSVFRNEPGNAFHLVEKGARRVVSRALCVLQTFGKKCERCPNSEATIYVAMPP